MITQRPEHEQYGRLGQFDPTVVNPNAGGLLGGYRYASTCNCNFYKSAYPYGLGPRIGMAYQLTPKTVLRAGWGLNYQFIANPAGGLVASSGAYPLSGINPFVNIATPGAIVQPIWPATNPTIYPIAGTAGVAGQTPSVPDQNENRPPRINQFSASIQREITRDFVVEASYVANRAVWLAGSLGRLSQISPQTYASYGLYPYPGTGPAGYSYMLPGDTQRTNGTWTLCVPGNDCDRALLTQSVSSAAVQQKMAAAGHPNFTPYSGFPAGNSLQSALYPFPQYGNLCITGSPTGDTKYDSLQIKVTKRLSHGLQAGGNFTWGQGFQRPARQDFFNPADSSMAIAEHSASGPELQRDLHGAESQLPAAMGQRGHQRLAGGMVRELPERHVSDAAYQPDCELPEQRGNPGSGSAFVHGRCEYQRSQHFQSVYHTGAEPIGMAGVPD